jgi:hypothetical protein
MISGRRALLAGSVAVAALAPAASLACTAAEMAKTENGLVQKVIAGSDKIAAYTDSSGTTEAFRLDLMQPYFVICEESGFFRVTDIAALTVEQAEAGQTGFVRAEQVFQWNTREALNFSEVAFLEGRPEIVAWEDELVLNAFLETGNMAANPPAFKENLTATLARARETRPYPVLGSDTRMVRKTSPKRVFQALVPAALTPADRLVVDGGAENAEAAAEIVEAALTSATFLFVFDATGSMGPFALETANAIAAAVNNFDPQVRDNSKMGILFYRDEGDIEKLVEVPPIPVAEAAEALRKAASLMDGGGDAPEPVLDAVYYGVNFYPWEGDAGQGVAGAKVIIAVLNDDAKPATIGTLDDKGRVPPGLDAVSVARAAFDKSIPVIAVQAGPNEGPNLGAVLQGLAEGTPRGTFVSWGAGLREADVAKALANAATVEAKAKIEGGERALEKVAFDLNGFPTIPLEVLDGEMIERLRQAGLEFNIELGEGGVLVRKAYIVENNDLLSPVMQIDKETLQDLINLYSVLATTGMDPTDFVRAVNEAVAAISGEEVNPEETLQDIVQRALGVQFRSDLLNFNLEFIGTLNPTERLAFGKRIQEASTNLNYFMEANLAEFDRLPAVWMPIAALP